MMKKAKNLKIVALIPAGCVVAVLLLFTIGETAGGDVSGLGHLIQLIPIAFLMWLGWHRPRLGGICLLLLSLVAAYSLADALRGEEWIAPFFIIVAPLLLSGSLFLGAAALEHKTA